MTASVTLREIHDWVSPRPRLNNDRVVDDPAWISALMGMRPVAEPLRRGERWVETRSHSFGDGRTLYAVVVRDERAVLRVTAHTNVWEMFAERSRLDEEILGRPRVARTRG